MAQFYRLFVKDFASIVAPLNVFKSKNADFVWTPQCQESFDTLRTKLAQYPLLAFHDGKSTLKLQINTDASNKGIGGVLQQVTSKGHCQPIQYLSRTLSPREQKYSVVEKECLGIVWCITKLRPYLYGKPFTLITDHHPLCWLNKQSSKNVRLDRWSLQLQEYSFNIKHTPGSSNCVVDDLAEGQLELMHGHVNSITTTPPLSQLQQQQQTDPKVKQIWDALTAGKQVVSFLPRRRSSPSASYTS